MDQLSHVIPLLVHGDEGTGSKKSPVSIVNWQSVWGHETDKTKHLKSQSCFSDCSACNKYSSKIEKCCKVPDSWPKARDKSFKLTDEDFRELLSQYPTTSSHSFLTRHLVFVLPTYLVKKGPEVLNAALAACARDLKELFDTGIDVRGIRFHGALLALKGDQKWHAATGRFVRSYNHLADVKNKPICHECLGGDPLFPFEDTSSGARWVETLFESEPWFQAGPLELIPFDEGMPARKYKRDLLHTFKIGLGRDIAGSTICLLARFFGWFDHEGDSLALENRLKRAHSRLVLWASAEGRQLHLRGFTKEFMHLPRVDNFPWTNSKGSDTMVLLQWLYFELSLAAAALEGHRRLDLLRVAKQVCKAGGDVFRLLYSHGLLVPRSCMVVLRDELLRVTRGYSYLATECLMEKFPAYSLKTTIHGMQHFAVEVDISIQTSCEAMVNPLMMDCSQCEDFIGRIARVCRSTHSSGTALRSLQRHLVKTKLLLKKPRKSNLKLKGRGNWR